MLFGSLHLDRHLFSAYMKDPEWGWMATHRLPMRSAIFQCQEHHRRYDHPVALVPNNTDPAPYLQIAEKLAG